MDTNELRARALEGFRSRVHGIPDDAWTAPTPCTEWDVRDLVNHMVAELEWSVELALGRTIAEVGDRFDGDVLGDDPVATADRAIDASVQAFAGEHADPVDTSMGPMPAEAYLSQMLTDAVVHGWDLAVATGQEPDLDPEAWGVAYARMAAAIDEVEGARGAGVFGPQVTVPDNATDADRLLGLLGRDPRAAR